MKIKKVLTALLTVVNVLIALYTGVAMLVGISGYQLFESDGTEFYSDSKIKAEYISFLPRSDEDISEYCVYLKTDRTTRKYLHFSGVEEMEIEPLDDRDIIDVTAWGSKGTFIVYKD